MIKYQRQTMLGQPLAPPADLPPELVGLSNESLADLSWTDAALGYHGQRFMPVEVTVEVPQEPRRIARIQFMQRIPAAARIAIRTAGKTNPIVEDFLDLLAASLVIELDHNDTVMGLGYLQQQGLLTAEDVAAILE